MLSVLFAWVKINRFELTVVDAFEGTVRTSLEVDGINEELSHIEKVLQAVGQVGNSNELITADGVTYSSYEIERLRSEQANLLLHKKEKELELTASNHVKRYVMNDIRLLFVMMLIALIIGTLLSVLGILGLYLRIELFEDRRKKPR
ncbi:MAG: hypothetical protein OEY87_10625 [Gammaproteobacteria bacterium]|nr:hypothetical protein [Gammaproteobacteria bacterium]MDH5736564.1 hypothetical protein [Gammaproteobacteria bacterium]